MINRMIDNLLKLNISKRVALIDSLLNKGISDKILQVINKIPREYFLSEEYYNIAYEDRALPIGNNQTISQPYTVCLMTELLEVKNGNKILEIGTGSGYQSLVLKMLNLDNQIFTIERIEALYQKSLKVFGDFELEVNAYLGDGSIGLEEFAPFERIIVTASSPKIPEKLKSQLEIGGIMIIPVGNRKIQTMYKIKRIDSINYIVTEHSNFKFVPLIGKYGWEFENE